MIVQLFILYNCNSAVSTTNLDKKNIKVARGVDLKIIKIYLNKKRKNLQKF